MAFVNVPEWTAREIVTAAKLGQYTSALQGFAAQPADIAWDLIAQGNINFDSQNYSILNLRTFWSIINADEYDTFQAAIDAAEIAGGGTVLIPPDTVVNATAGVTVESSLVSIIGCGPSSVIQLTGDGTAITLGKASASYSDLMVANLKIDGSGVSAATGIRVRRIARPRIHNVWFSGVASGDALVFTNDGTVGNACTDAQCSNLYFTSSGSNDIFADDLDGAQFTHIYSTGAGSDSIYMENSDGNSIIRDINISDSRIDSPGGKGIYIVGQSGTAGAQWSRVSLDGVTVVDPTDDGIQVGDTSKIIQDVSITGCAVQGTITADGFVVNADQGTVSGCTAVAAGGDGLDMLDSEELNVQGNNFKDATENGIDASALSASANCSIWNNNVRNYGGAYEGVSKPTGLATSSTTDIGQNLGDHGKLMGATISQVIDDTNAGAGVETSWTYTIPGGTLTKAGDGLRAATSANITGSGIKTIYIQVDGNTIAVYSVNTSSADNLYTEGVAYLNSVGVTGSNNTAYLGFGMDGSGGTEVVSSAAGDFTIDWRSDVDITVKIQANDGATRIVARDVVLQLFEGKLGGTL